jgi:hypothetical protein
MSNAPLRSSRTKRYARRLAAGLVKNKVPAPTPDLDDYFEHFPEDVFVALEGFIELSAAGTANDNLAAGHLLLILGLLERIRYRCERGYDDAIRLVEKFQHTLADLSATGRIDGSTLSMVASVLHQAGVSASAELTEAVAQNAKEFVPLRSAPNLAALLDDLAKECGGDPFVAASMMAETGHAMPADGRALIAAEQVRSANPVIREGAVLLLLDPEPEVRRAAAAELQARITGLSPASVLRLITMRNWRAEAERPLVDAIVRAARAKGIACAAWPDGIAEAILASCIDGSGAQGFLILSPAGRRKRLSSVLLKNGVRDAWTGPPESRRGLQSALGQAAAETSMMPVSRGYFDRALRHHLHLGIAAGALPPAGLLQVAETIGGAHWQPERVDWRQALAALLAELPAALLEPQAVNTALDSSKTWADFDSISESWFEDDQDVARQVGAARGRQRTKALNYVLQSVLEHRREKWAEHFVSTALWLKEAPVGARLPWWNFAILARALSDGHDLSDISLMRDIAARTVAALTQR